MTTRTITNMTVPYYVNEQQSDIRAIKPGWYGLERNGKLSSGPFPNEEKCLNGIARPRSNFAHLPWLRTSRCQLGCDVASGVVKLEETRCT